MNRIAISLCAIIVLVSGDVRLLADALPRVHAEADHIADADGRTIFLHGVNLGNWLLFEPTGFDKIFGDFPDQYTMFKILRDRFGEAERRRLVTVFRDNFITARDFDYVKTFGFNFIRVGFDYDLMEDDSAPMQLRPDGFKYLDFAVAQAKARGLYVLIDLHGAQERQVAGKQGGRARYSRFWDDAKAQERSLWLWNQVQRHFKGDTTVMGYEPLNEPFSAQAPQLRDYCLRWYKQLRGIDEQAIAVFPSWKANAFDFYGKPSDNGWTNCVVDVHFYPGSFARPTATQPVTPDVNNRFIQRGLPRWADRAKAAQVPLLVGEMNVVFKAAGGGEMVRRYFDFAQAHDWAISYWTLKEFSAGGGVHPRQWSLTTNATPIKPVDVRTSSESDIEAAFRDLAVHPLVTDDDLLHWLTTSDKPSPLAKLAPPSTTRDVNVPTGAQPQ